MILSRFFIVIIAIVFSSFTQTQASVEAKFLKIASVQYHLEGNRSQEQFFKKIEDLIKQSVQQKAELILFPEWITLDTWPLGSKKSDREVVSEIAKNLTPSYWEKLKFLSKKYNLVIAGGSTAKISADKLFNVAALVFPNGKIMEHKKVYLTKWEIDNGLSAGDQPTVFDTQWGKMALLICYDIEFPDISVDLSKHEIDIILVPSMTESESGKMRVRWTSQSRAIEHTSYVVISPTVGETSKDWKHFGNAVFLSPQLPGLKGVLKEDSSSKSSVLVYNLDLEKLRELKKNSSWRPSKQIRKR